MGRSFSPARGPVALQLDPEYFSYPTSTLDANEHNQNIDRKSAATTGPNASNHASYSWSFQPGSDIVDGSPHHLGRTTSSSSPGSAKEEVSTMQWLYERHLIETGDSMRFTMSTLPKPSLSRWPAVLFYNKSSSSRCRALPFIVYFPRVVEV